MNTKWKKATERYEQQEPGVEKQDQLSKGAKEVVRDLEQFMASEDGQLAIALLKASGENIDFGDEKQSGFIVFWSLGGDGFYKTGRDKTSITAEEAVAAAISFYDKKPEEIMPWLRQSLDEIADAAP